MSAQSANGAVASGQHPRVTLRHRGYSLIEVLVAMLVLAILVSIMLPALHQTMRYSAPLVRCSANMRQLHQALMIYLGSSQDMMPAAGYEALRDASFPPLNKTLAEYGVEDISYWQCPADVRPEVVTERWGSMVYPPGRYMRSVRRRIRLDELGPEYPLLADRGPFHLQLEENGQSMVPADFTADPVKSPMLSGFYEGHNSVWVSGRVTSHTRDTSRTRP